MTRWWQELGLCERYHTPRALLYILTKAKSSFITDHCRAPFNLLLTSHHYYKRARHWDSIENQARSTCIRGPTTNKRFPTTCVDIPGVLISPVTLYSLPLLHLTSVSSKRPSIIKVCWLLRGFGDLLIRIFF